MSDNENPRVEEPLPSDGHNLAPASAAANGQTSGRDGKGDDELRVSTKEEILVKLDQMPGLIATGLLPTTRANAMRGIYQTMLASLNDSSPSGAAAMTDEDVLTILRAQPDLLKMLHPFLSRQQLELIVREAVND